MARMLLAEDDDSMRLFLGRALERAGHEVTSVSKGTEALPFLKPDCYELLLADIVMPEMDGVELARRMMAADDKVKVMFITGFAAVAMQQREDPTIQAKILSKPFHLRDLVAEVDRSLETSRAPAAGR